MPSSQSLFSLDISGVAGFLGGETSVLAMATVHVYEGRKWLGWYNQPGSYEVARRYGQVSNSRFWDALYPGVNLHPATLFGFDGTHGPKYTAIFSGTVLQKTGHIARLFLEVCNDLAPCERPKPAQRTTPAAGSVTVVSLMELPADIKHPRQPLDMSSMLAVLPILASVAACVLCAMWGDWYCSSMILLGIVASGISCYVIGSATLRFDRPELLRGTSPGDGLLNGEAGLVVLKGPKDPVNSILRGRFALQYTSKPQYHDIGICSLLLTVQFLAQLLIVPQGTLHGQILFLGSLACSWAYSSYLSSIDREHIQRRILVDEVLRLRPGQLQKYELGTRTATVVFILLLLSPATPRALERVFDDLLPNNTDLWVEFKAEVLRCIAQDFQSGFPGFSFAFGPATGVHLRDTLRADAEDAAEMYGRYCRTKKLFLGSPAGNCRRGSGSTLA